VRALPTHLRCACASGMLLPSLPSNSGTLGKSSVLWYTVLCANDAAAICHAELVANKRGKRLFNGEFDFQRTRTIERSAERH